MRSSRATTPLWWRVPEEELLSDDEDIIMAKDDVESARAKEERACAYVALPVEQRPGYNYYEFWRHYLHCARVIEAYSRGATLRSMGYPDRVRRSWLYVILVTRVVHLGVAWTPTLEDVHDTSQTYL